MHPLWYAAIGVLVLFFVMKPKKKKGPDTWADHVLPHGPLMELIPGRMWQVEGTLTRGPDRNMVVYKMSNGGLLLHSVVSLDDEGMRRLESFGKPQVMIVPNRMHRSDAKVYADRYPQMLVVCPLGAKAKVEEVVKTHTSCEELFQDAKFGVTALPIDGIKAGSELAYILDCGAGGRALVVTDLLFNIVKPVKGMQWFMGTLFGSLGPLHLSRLGKLTMGDDTRKLKVWLTKLGNSEPPFKVISVAHGSPVTTECNRELKLAAERLG